MKLTGPQAEEDARFWLNQDREHQLFYTLGIREPSLHDEARRLHEAYEQALEKDDLGAAFNQILPRSQAFKSTVLNAMAQGMKPGALYPLFFAHTKMELDAMVARVTRGLTAVEELCLGNRIDAEHAAFARQLLDPTEVDAQVVAEGAEAVAGQLARTCADAVYPSLVELSKRSAASLDKFVSSDLPKRRSIIHPVLLKHVEREGRRFLKKLDELPADAPAGQQTPEGGSA